MIGGEGERRRILAKIGLTSMSAAAAETATFPIDIIKTRLQLHGEHHLHRRPDAISATKGSAFRVAADIWRKGGALGFYSGLPPAILRHLFYTPIRIVGYEHLRNAVGADGSVIGKAIAGGSSGVLSQVVASPADLIKVRMQADSQLISQGLQPRYAGIFDALSKIIRTEGFLGLWRGVFPNAQRAFLVNMGELACYDQAKHFIIGRRICEDNVFAHSLASVASGLSATALSCPADVIKTRMMNQAVGKETSIAYRNSFDCLVKTEIRRHIGIVEGFLSYMGETGTLAICFLGFLRKTSTCFWVLIILMNPTPSSPTHHNFAVRVAQII